MNPVLRDSTLRRACGMSDTLFTKIHEAANYLKLDIELQEIAELALNNSLSVRI